ncbi:mycothiol-dependent nitroreductase Rv2466c family protein [Corynebacterium kalidii]|uniref:Disulfide bond formation protein DsbA n=1 Tax=Corynebacterium kalidii TaxID=2931982 RepID=A0A9X1WKT6_9CORY|nr:disulfide bond formation protein DsbA [Corynebacterium kalidii]MCJ7858287.1 disulfide bond formation protein DsbA [Corynebacterium kalidii]
MSNANTPVTLYFDATCPFAWVTSRWIKEVEAVRDVDVTFAPMSLAVLNEDKDIPADYASKMTAAWGPALVAAAVYTREPEKVDALYTALGTRIHDQGQGGRVGDGAYDDLIAEALDEAGLSADYAAAAHSRGDDAEAWEPTLRSYHATALAKVGDDVGTPVVELEGRAFFGPVLTRVPRGEDAGKIFDAAVTLGGYDHFYELKKTRSEDPSAV